LLAPFLERRGVHRGRWRRLKQTISGSRIRTGTVWALIGDAAATSDPTGGPRKWRFRSAMRECLRDHLLASPDWDRAGHAYASEHDDYFARVPYRNDMAAAKVFQEQTPEARLRRQKAMPLIAEDPTRPCPTTCSVGRICRWMNGVAGRASSARFELCWENKKPAPIAPRRAQNLSLRFCGDVTWFP